MSALGGVPRARAPLHQAWQLQAGARVEFDWSDIRDVFVKLEEEIGELRDAIARKNRKHVIEELGDLMFSVVNVARSKRRWIRRAGADQRKVAPRAGSGWSRRITGSSRRMKDCTLAEMDAIWDLRAEDEAGRGAR